MFQNYMYQIQNEPEKVRSGYRSLICIWQFDSSININVHLNIPTLDRTSHA